MSQVALSPVPEPPAQGSLENTLAVVSNQMINIVDRFSKVADRGPYILLTSLGAALLVIGLLAKINIFTYRPFDIATVEFITMEVLGVLLLLAGCWLRFYEFRSQHQFLQEHQRVYAEMVARTNALAEAATKAIIEKRVGL